VSGPIEEAAGGSNGSGSGVSSLIIYVDSGAGDDRFDGASDQVLDRVNLRGPTKTINAALALAHRENTVCVREGTYKERVETKGIRLTTNGRVVID
jgi:hypothetical protein